jgi:hypothetical protein
MNRRQVLQHTIGAAVAAVIPVIGVADSGPKAGATDSQNAARSLPKSVAGVALPDTKLAVAAYELASGAYTPYLLNHALRTYVFGALAGRAQRKEFDEETLYIACVLHDLGLTTKYEGDLPFEIQGAEAARKFLNEQGGVAAEKVEMIWDGIAMHVLAIGGYKRPEIALVGAGAGADVVGPDPAEIPPAKVAEVLNALPRLKFKEEFVKNCADVGRRHPRAAGRTFMRDIAERYVADYHPRNFCDVIEKAPFQE